jgi:hypothetical protein
MDMKDFFYNIGKSLCIGTILENKEYRSQLMYIFYNFVDYEYSALYFSRNSLKLVKD